MIKTRIASRVLLVVLVASLAAAPVIARGIATTTTKAQEFFGSKRAKVVYTYSGSVYYIDFTESPLAEHKIFTGTVVDQSLQISPDGARICYSIGTTTYIRPVKESTTEVKSVCSGTFPHWWTNPTSKDEYLIVQRSDGMYCQKLNSDNSANGAATKLMGNKFANGGRTRDGKYLVSDEEAGMWQLSPSDATTSASIGKYIVFGGIGNDSAYCNGSASPATSTSSQFYGCAFHLGRHHTEVYVRKFGIEGVLKSGVLTIMGNRLLEMNVGIINDGEFVHTEWSTHEQYVSTAGMVYDGSAAQKTTANGYVIDLVNKKSLKFMSLGLMFTHLWVQDASAPVPVKARISANKTSGPAPLAVDFDGSASTGNSLTYAWNFGDNGTASAVKPSHTFVANGTYTVKLKVTSGSTSDSATTTITVSSQVAAPASIEVVPSGVNNVVKGQKVEFTAIVKDQSGQTMTTYSALTWKIVGTGGTITSAGLYTAGVTIGKTDTIVAQIGSVTGKSVVKVTDLPLILTSQLSGKSFAVGTKLTVSWTVDTVKVSSVAIQFSRDGGQTWNDIVGNSVPAKPSTWEWTIPASFAGNDGSPVSTVSTTAKIKIDKYDNSGDVTPSLSGNFTIQNGSAVYSKIQSLTGIGKLGKTTVFDPSGRSIQISKSNVGAKSSGCRLTKEISVEGSIKRSGSLSVK